MSIKSKIKTVLAHPMAVPEKFLIEGIGPLLSDKTYLQMTGRIKCGYKLNLENPQTFNEKLNWLKLYDRRDVYTTMADKYAVKQFVAEKIGIQYVVENYGRYNSWEEIDFTILPNQFVMKGTHDSGGAFICRDKATFDFEGTRKRLEHNLNFDYFKHCREWPYKNIPRGILIDRFLDDHTGKQLRDYKWWCFDGEPKYMYCTIKGAGVYENFYDMNFSPVDINHGFPRHQPEFEKPSQFEIMKDLATMLSKGIPFVRVDFFQVGEQVFFGEFTFYDWGGLKPFATYEQDLKLGRLITLP